jgi:hypothetical protein
VAEREDEEEEGRWTTEVEVVEEGDEEGEKDEERMG